MVAGAGLATVWYLSSLESGAKDQPAEVDKVEQAAELPPEPTTLKFAAMGDMLAHDSVVDQAKTNNGYEFTTYFERIKPLYAGSDVVFCNPETPAAGSAYGVSGYPTFNAPTEFTRDLSEAGCNLINMASNHAVDKGQQALVATLDEWQKYQPLAMTGANRNAQEQQQVQYFEKNGIKVAFLAFADFSNGSIPYAYSINLYHDKALVTQLMTQARQNADAVVVSMHWGVEDSHQVSADQRAAAKMVAGLGADVIIGTGPHVLQPVEWLDVGDGHKTLVWYSIGNMLSSQLQTDELTGGVALFELAKTDAGVEISNIEFKATFMSYEWSQADRLARRLETRRNLKLQPLAEAGGQTELFGVTVAERTVKVHDWLGQDVELKITP